MPTEKKVKKKDKEVDNKEPVKPLGYYVKDRVELTKQLFSCLKTKQIKNRIPPNLRNKSIERIQQICLDEILGISTKRLLSIINDTICPENTDSSDDDDDSDIAEVLSLDEISSDSEAEAKVKVEQVKNVEENKEKPKEISKPKEKSKKDDKEKPPKSAKEMTMLELLELQARARAIRSQLALEPVTKIDLSDEEKEDENTEKVNEIPKIIRPTPPPAEEESLVVKLPEIVVQPSKPVKIKRNYKGQLVIPERPKPQEKDDDEKSDSSDIITVDPNLETYFISDSEEEEEGETPTKKLATEEEKEKVDEIEENNIENETEEGEVNSRENSPTKIDETDENIDGKEEVEETTVKEIQIEEQEEDDVVNLMSDTEIDPNIDIDDGNIVDLQVGENELIDESDKEGSKPTETWEDRWLSSSKTQKVLRTTKIASKIREKALKTKKSKKENDKKKLEKEKEILEKITCSEEGSMKQFENLKEIVEK